MASGVRFDPTANVMQRDSQVGDVSVTSSRAPPLGAGVGPTPDSPLSPLEPYPVTPVALPLVQHTIETVRRMFVLTVDDIHHIEWLMVPGLTRADDAHAA